MFHVFCFVVENMSTVLVLSIKTKPPVKSGVIFLGHSTRPQHVLSVQAHGTNRSVVAETVLSITVRYNQRTSAWSADPWQPDSQAQHI